MLTGSSQQQDPSNGSNGSNGSNPSSKVSSSIPPVKKQSFKLYERRNSLNLKNGLMINPMGPRFGSSSSSPRVQELLSPSILDFPSLVLSPVTPLVEDPFDKKEEERVIKEKGFYLHPSPRAVATTRGSAEPRLLPLFPVTSPRSSLS
ncbi:VQ-like protein [Artemisia annua]|uniref:VQ-like protein n=1 Tax=Artemisia annua TaxID=35608 RepID=A0A2U1QH08_ARTAN|nr:VQ-like protein [Artemisia annua]